jgi:hypothetical protein
MWVNAREREKNKEKHVNGAMFLTISTPPIIPLLDAHTWDFSWDLGLLSAAAYKFK